MDPHVAKQIVGDRMSLMGNLNNPTTLFGGDFDLVYEESMKVLESGVEGLAPEGSVPLGTSMETLKGMSAAARDYSNTHRTNGRLIEHDIEENKPDEEGTEV